MEVSPEQKRFARKLEMQHGYVRSLTKEMYVRFVADALEFQSAYWAFWRSDGMRFLHVHRLDRQPLPEEFLPIVQELFVDGQVHSGTGHNMVELMQGEALYSLGTIADNMGTALSDYADKKDEVEQFDFEWTALGKRLNGRH